MADPKIKRVLMSVTDKTGVVDFARALHDEFGAEIISTGGTAKVIAEAGVPVTPIDEVTHFPEMMDGRVKTLHPMVHGGLLAKRDNPQHMAEAAEHGIQMIDMVVVNLYAFEKTVESGADFGTCIENIDIGGPSMLRSAAKNFESVAVVTDPESYNDILAEMRENGGATKRSTRARLALNVFETTRLLRWGHRRLDVRAARRGGRLPRSRGRRRVPRLLRPVHGQAAGGCATARTRIRKPPSTVCPTSRASTAS